MWLTYSLSHLYSHSTLSLKGSLSKEVMHLSMVAVNQADATQRSQFTNFTGRTILLKDVTFFQAGKRRRTKTHKQLKCNYSGYNKITFYWKWLFQFCFYSENWDNSLYIELRIFYCLGIAKSIRETIYSWNCYRYFWMIILFHLGESKVHQVLCISNIPAGA